MARKTGDGIEVREGEEVAGKTIVGGRPLKRRKVKLNIPAGIEKTIYKAAIDPGFKSQLFEDRLGTIESHGFKLTDMERTLLESIPDQRLELIIGQIRPEHHGKRMFLPAVAPAVVTLATGTAVVACDMATRGSTAEPPDATVDIEDEDSMPVDGIMPDAPPDVPDLLTDSDDDADEDDADDG